MGSTVVQLKRMIKIGTKYLIFYATRVTNTHFDLHPYIFQLEDGMIPRKRVSLLIRQNSFSR